MSTISRRGFLMGLATAASALRLPVIGRAFETRLYPPVDLSYFDKSITPAPADITFGYAAITWQGDDTQAIADVSALGFKGIQLRANVLTEYGARPGALRDLLDQHHLEMVALSSGSVSPAAGREADEIAKHAQHAAFVRDVRGRYLQVTDSGRPKTGKPAAGDYEKLGRLLTEIGKRSADLGIPLGYHNHMSSLGEAPDEVDRILDSADSRYVKLELDIAHYQQGGGDPARAIERYRDRLLFLHIKDLETLGGTGGDGRPKYRFVELGRGSVNLPAVFAVLRKINYRGWAVIELDSVPDKARTPKDSAAISKRYVEEKLRMKI